MTAYSKSDLATRALRDLGLIGAEETPSAIDLSFAEETLSSEIDLLASKGIVIWNGSEVEIPNGYLTTLSRRIGMALGPSFGLMSIPDATKAMFMTEVELRKVSSVAATGSVLQSDYF